MDLNQVLLIPLVWKGGCKKVWKKLDFSPSAKFFIVYTSVLNPFQYKIAILKDKDFKTNTTQDFLQTMCTGKWKLWYLRLHWKYLKLS